MKAVRRFLVYIIIVHLAFGGALGWALWDCRPCVLGVEAFVLLSLLVAWRLAVRAGEPARLVATGVELIAGGDFTTRFEERGRPELDALIRVYNRMVDDLRAERVRNEEQESFLRRIVGASPLGVVTLDFDGRVADVNPAAEMLLDRPADALRGRRLAELDLPLASRLAALGPGETRIEPWHSGRRLRLEMGGFMDRGFPRGYYLVQELTEELRRSEKQAYGKLIRMMAHEVNNTTGAVSSLLRSCLRYAPQVGGEDREDFTGALDVAVRRSEGLDRFMKRFADVVRIPPPTRQDCDLAALVEGIARLLDGEAARRRVALTLELAERPVLPLDPALMEQALVNVLRNALEAVGEDGRVALRLRRENGGLVLEVEDSGPGIAPEARAELFTPFFTTKKDGQGIGLTMVREILDGHGLAFTLDSDDGGPTRFRILLQA